MRRKGDIPNATALQPSNKDPHIGVFFKLAQDLGAVLNGAIAEEVDEAPFLAVAHAAQDSGEGAPLDVDYDLLSISKSQYSRADSGRLGEGMCTLSGS